MTEADRPTFARMLYALGDTFNEPVSELRAEAYFDALSDLSIDEVLTAGRTAIRDARFFPRPVELRELVEGKVEDLAELAWAAMLRVVKRVGFYNQPTAADWPDDATRRAALDLYGGWKALCENLPAGGPEMLGVRKVFIATYAAYVRGQDRTTALPPSRDEARQQLRDIKAALVARGLPMGDL